MKRLFYSLFIMLMALPAIAEVTDTPVITVSESGPGYTITVEGDGLLNVQVVSSPELEFGGQMEYGVLDEAQVRDTYTFLVARNNIENFRCQVMATAQADGKEVSNVAIYEFIVVKFTDMPEPCIIFTETDDGLEINVVGEGRITCNVKINGEEFEAVELPYFVERQFVDLFIEVSATANGYGYDLMPSGSHDTYLLSAITLPLDPPVFTIETYDDYVVVTATADTEYDNCEVHLFLEGSEVENPCIIERTYEDRFLEFYAYCTVPGMEQSDYSYCQITVPAKRIDLPQTAVPTIAFELQNWGTSALVSMEYQDYEPGDIYYRYGLYDETTGDYGSFTSWKKYESEFVISGAGKYRVEAYAEAYYPDYNPSEEVAVEFELVAPTEQTLAPQITITQVDEGNYMLVDIIPSEDYCDLYYRIGIGPDGNNFSDWMIYNGPICFTEPDVYWIEAYAITPGKTQSVTAQCVFVLTEPVVPPVNLYDFEEDGIFYKITGENKVSVCSETSNYNTYNYYNDITIPATVTHEGVTYMVTAIDDHAFDHCSDLRSITIGAYVTSIGDYAFYYCNQLTSVTLGDYVITVGDGAFAGCSALRTVKLGSGLKRLGAGVFHACALESVTCKAATPPEIADEYCFLGAETKTLYVYPAVLDSYKAADYWKLFGNIVPEDNVVPTQGDMNGDGILNVGDVTSLIRQVLSGN